MTWQNGSESEAISMSRRTVGVGRGGVTPPLPGLSPAIRLDHGGRCPLGEDHAAEIHEEHGRIIVVLSQDAEAEGPAVEGANRIVRVGLDVVDPRASAKV